MARSELSWKSLKVAIGCSVGMFVSSFPIIIILFSICLLPITKEFGWGRAKVSLALTISELAGALANLTLGRLIDRWGARVFVLPGVALFALANLTMSTMHGSISLFYALYFLFGCTVVVDQIGYTKVLSGWFHRIRGTLFGLALGLTYGLALATWPFLARLLIRHFGWRGAHTGIGIIILVVALPVLFFLLKDPPRYDKQDSTLKRFPVPNDQDGISSSEAIRSVKLWLIIGANFLILCPIVATHAHMVAMVIDRGFSAALAVSVLSTYSIGSIIGAPFVGIILDRFNTALATIPFYLSALLGVICLHSASTLIMFGIGSALIGISSGALITIMPYLLTRYFGLRAFGQLYGTIQCFGGLAGGIAPFAMGAVFDATHSYRLAFIGLEVGLLLAITFLSLLGPYAYSANVPEVEKAPEPPSLKAIEMV